MEARDENGGASKGAAPLSGKNEAWCVARVAATRACVVRQCPERRAVGEGQPARSVGFEIVVGDV